MEDVIIITNPMIAANESAKVTLSKFLRVIEPCCRNLQVLGGNLRIEGDLKQVQLVSVPIKRRSKQNETIIRSGVAST